MPAPAPVTHSQLISFLSALLPPKPHDVPLLYHVPFCGSGGYDLDTAPVARVILSVTPTKNVYDAVASTSTSNNWKGKWGKGTQALLRADSQDANEEVYVDGEGEAGNRIEPPNTIAFLHRPYTLDRARIGNNLLVLASHTSFDENLTVGWNPALAARLGVDVSAANEPDSNVLCITGHKGDASRKAGTLARVNLLLGPLLQSLESEFGSISHAQEGLSEEIHVLAMMNSFSADDVDRVLDLASERNWVPSVEQLGTHVLYLTAQPRMAGLEKARHRGMTVVCVGKRVAEQWGITYLGQAVRREFPGVEVLEVYEDELEGRG